MGAHVNARSFRSYTLQSADECDAIGVHLADFVDRDIFARDKTLVREVKANIVGEGAVVVVERPSATLAMNEMAVLIRPVWPQPRDPAGFPVRAPEVCIDPAVAVDRCNNHIGDGRFALGMAGFAGQFDADLPELGRE